jgi:NADH dehydrogenase
LTPDREGAGRPRVVVIGAGFAGLWAIQKLRNEPVDLVLIDRNNYHTFLPLLYQVAASELGPTDIAYPVRSILRKARNMSFHLGAVRNVDLDARVVSTDSEVFPYDHLIVAMGATTHWFGVEGAAEHAFPLRTMEEAVPLRVHLLGRFEEAASEPDPERRKRLLTFTVVGGGPTGVEFSGALAELIHGPLDRDFPNLDMSEVRIILLEAMDRVLQGMPDRLSTYARDRLERRGVEVRFGARVARVEPHAVVLAGGEVIESDSVVWTAGVRGAPGPEAWGLPMAPGARVRVGPTLEVPGRPGVWCAGDLAWFEHKGEALPGVAPVALQQGTLVAKNILARLRGAEPRAFVYRDPGMLAVIGRNAAVAHLGGRSFTGLPAWAVWLVVHVAKLIGFRNRILVLVNWAWNYVFFDRAARLILPYVRVGPREAAPPEIGRGPRPSRTAPDSRPSGGGTESNQGS